MNLRRLKREPAVRAKTMADVERDAAELERIYDAEQARRAREPKSDGPPKGLRHSERALWASKGPSPLDVREVLSRLARCRQAHAAPPPLQPDRVSRMVLEGHYLAQVVCDHDRKMDNPICSCSQVFLGWHPSVGEAVQAWVDHVMEVERAGS